MQNLNVLVIDDSEDDRYLLSRDLQKIFNFEFINKKFGKLNFFEEKPTDVISFIEDQNFEKIFIFLDMNMGSITGVDVLKLLNGLNNDLLKCIYVVMCTSSNAEKDKIACADYSFVKGYMVKGSSRLELATLVNTIDVLK